MGYQRSQIISALWAVYAGPFIAAVPLKAVPKKFVRRVGNLLDRGIGITPDRRAGQKGVFQEYEIADAAELGIGLSLLNVGLPQLEAISFLLACREQIREGISAVPLSSYGAKFPHFLVLRPHSLDETQRQYDPLPYSVGSTLAFYEPIFVHDAITWTSIAENFHIRPRERIVIEIGDLISQLNVGLAQTQVSNRGRQ